MSRLLLILGAALFGGSCSAYDVSTAKRWQGCALWMEGLVPGIFVPDATTNDNMSGNGYKQRGPTYTTFHEKLSGGLFKGFVKTPASTWNLRAYVTTNEYVKLTGYGGTYHGPGQGSSCIKGYTDTINVAKAGGGTYSPWFHIGTWGSTRTNIVAKGRNSEYGTTLVPQLGTVVAAGYNWSNLGEFSTFYDCVMKALEKSPGAQAVQAQLYQNGATDYKVTKCQPTTINDTSKFRRQNTSLDWVILTTENMKNRMSNKTPKFPGGGNGVWQHVVLDSQWLSLQTTIKPLRTYRSNSAVCATNGVKANGVKQVAWKDDNCSEFDKYSAYYTGSSGYWIAGTKNKEETTTTSTTTTTATTTTTTTTTATTTTTTTTTATTTTTTTTAPPTTAPPTTAAATTEAPAFLYKCVKQGSSNHLCKPVDKAV